MASKPGGGGRGGKKKFTSKGGNRHFSDFDELKKQTEEIKREKALQQLRGDADSDEEEEAPKLDKPKVVNFDKQLTKNKKPATKKGPNDDSGSASSSEGGGESSSDDADDEGDDQRAKGVQHLIAIDNPNRVQQKMKKIKDLNFDDSGPSTNTVAAVAVAAADGDKAQLSRKEREALDAERRKLEYQRLHAQGKTDEARADLARLAIIKKQREEAAKKREDDKKAKEEADTKQAKAKLEGKH